MNGFLMRLLKTYRFEEMRIPLGVLATNLSTGNPVSFSGTGQVFDAVRASCSYPGLFQPVRHQGQLFVDGAISMEIPAALARRLGATHVISVYLPAPSSGAQPRNMFHVVNRLLPDHATPGRRQLAQRNRSGDRSRRRRNRMGRFRPRRSANRGRGSSSVGCPSRYSKVVAEEPHSSPEASSRRVEPVYFCGVRTRACSVGTRAYVPMAYAIQKRASR
jgi:predicted acylesterase/phospholipase RssA